MNNTHDIAYLKRSNKPDLAYIYSPAAPGKDTFPAIIFCGGFKSDMMGSKAEFLEAQCHKDGRAFLRLDYSGHGYSGGAFQDGTIGQWAQDVEDVIHHLNLQNFIIVGSSMGGWIGFLIAHKMRERVYGLIGIAAAPDFTDDLYYNRLDNTQREAINRDGLVKVPNEYSEEPYTFTKDLIEDGRKNFVLGREEKSHYSFPIHLIQGKNDSDVPWQRAIEIREAIATPHVDITFIEDGDHRLSREQDLDIIWNSILALTPQC